MKQNKKYLGLHNQDDSTAVAPSRFEPPVHSNVSIEHEARKFHVKQEEMEEVGDFVVYRKCDQHCH
jgi:hypothetical protein